MSPDAGRVASLLDRYGAATGAEVHSGRGWYEGEARAIRAMTPAGVEPDRAVVAAAVLSPRTTWEKLLGAFGPWLRGERTTLPAYGKMIERAEAILAGDEWIPARSAAPKTHSFARALLGDEGAVALDCWMFRAMGLDTLTVPVRTYNELTLDVIAASMEVGESPRDFQAVVWVKTRGLRTL